MIGIYLIFQALLYYYLFPKKYLNQITGSNQLGNPQQAGEKLGFFLDGKQIALPKQNITESNQLKPFEDEFLAITQQKPKAFKSEHLKKLLRPPQSLMMHMHIVGIYLQQAMALHLTYHNGYE